MSHSTIHDFYEKLLEEASFDLHERYSQLLTGLQWKANEEDSSLISYIIEDMRERSSCYSPITLRQWGAFHAWKSYAKQLGKRHGIQFEFQEAAFHEWNKGDPLLFRLLQQMIQFIINEGAPDLIRVSVESDTLLLLYEAGHITEERQEFPQDFANTAGVSVSVERNLTTAWLLKKKESDS
ncbi:hypothetical protein [Salimicrobium halophilum]|uniref:Two-component system, NarL family, sensor histidine kinase NreB n=1 Tax=Salimicrobium halophilum TaxID=86666 RepID=A0A1G8SZ26_9BACI|nr:hypothetical protein [Salimicrobium halophilum]SDJ34529.1 two-component system, NarL family, sensor histidine kinase NreB [Salimicrobium halophilum]